MTGKGFDLIETARLLGTDDDGVETLVKFGILSKPDDGGFFDHLHVADARTEIIARLDFGKWIFGDKAQKISKLTPRQMAAGYEDHPRPVIRIQDRDVWDRDAIQAYQRGEDLLCNSTYSYRDSQGRYSQ